MPLYIACHEQWQNNTAADFSPLLLEDSSLQMEYCVEEFVQKRGGRGDLLQDIFELTNPCSEEQPYILLPNGCAVMLFILHPHASACYLCGPLTAARRIFVPAGGVFLCARLKPGRLGWLGKRVSAGLPDRAIPLQMCFADADALLERLTCLGTFYERCNELLGYLNKKKANEFCADPVIQTCIDWINESRGKCRIHELAREVSRSERFLSRTFRDATGLPMKTYSEIIKFQDSFYWILTQQPRNLSGVVKDYGYYDLPHMNRAYRKFINYTASDVRFVSMHELYVRDLLSE